MYTTKDIAKRYDLTAKQTRSLIDAVGPLLADDLARGPHNTILVRETSIPVLERAMDIKRDGASWTAVAEQLAREMTETPTGSGATPSPREGQTGVEQAPETRAGRSNEEAALEAELVAILKDQITDLKKDKELLQQRVRELEVLALPPESKRRQRVSRLDALKAALTGRL